jgi:hypothetical protein
MILVSRLRLAASGWRLDPTGATLQKRQHQRGLSTDYIGSS